MYKISLSIPGISIIRIYDPKDVPDILTDNDERRHRNFVLDSAVKNHKDIIDLVNFLQSYSSDLYSKRIERNNIDLYTNTKEIFDKLSSKFEYITTQRFEPSSNRLNLYDENTIVVKNYPHKKYHHKVFLLPHKMKHDKENKSSFLQWIENNSKILISEAVKNWFLTTDWNWDRRYILVEDEQTLLMLKLRSPEVIGRIYNYKLADK